MKQSRIIFVGLLGVAVLLSGCAWLDSLFNPTPELAKPTMTIPAALTSDLSRATGVPSSDAVFEPFRSSLDTAAAVLAQTYLFIDTIGANPIADSVTMPLMDGQRLEVSRKYSVPLLELCDKLGYTERRESERRRGPRL